MRRRSPSAFVTLLILPMLSLTVARAQTSPAGWTLDEEMKIRNISMVRVSPDGKSVAFTVSTAVMTPEKSEYVSQIWVAKSDGSGAMQLTFAEKSSDNPQWSPDGKSLAFTSARGGKNNLYVIRLDGGEAEQISDVKGGVSSFLWAPDRLRHARRSD
jgi:Tol biopolymer transport system component